MLEDLIDQNFLLTLVDLLNLFQNIELMTELF
jgi:hypothetical protein